MPRFAIAATLLSSFLALGAQAHQSSPECALKTNEAINGLAKTPLANSPNGTPTSKTPSKTHF